MQCDFRGCEATATANKALGLCRNHEAEIYSLTAKKCADAKVVRWHQGEDRQERARKSNEAWNDFFVRADFLRERNGAHSDTTETRPAPPPKCQCPYAAIGGVLQRPALLAGALSSPMRWM